MELAQSLLGEQFLQFSKNDPSGFHHIFSFLTGENHVFFRYSYLVVSKYYCVDFSEHRPEEVIKFFFQDAQCSTNENITKITKLNRRDYPHLVQNCENICTRNGVYTVEPRYNEVLGTMAITLLYQVSHYIRVKKQRNIKSWVQQNYLVIRGFCYKYIRPLYNEVPLYMYM